MNGISRKAGAVVAAGTLATVVGCHSGAAGERYKNYVDPCWPERYSTVARAEVLAPFQAQAANGTILDQTLWNYHFDANSDKLTAAGVEKLDYLARRRPAPDSKVYLQTARDVGFDGNAPEKLADGRRDLDQRRANMVQKYLAAVTAARPMSFEVQVIDPSDPGFGARYVGNAITTLPQQYTAVNAGAAAGGGGGQGGGGGGGGGQGGGR
jgi:outer membrane protein OmpA-like peptidoglycan-associated protein